MGCLDVVPEPAGPPKTKPHTPGAGTQKFFYGLSAGGCEPEVKVSPRE